MDYLSKISYYKSFIKYMFYLTLHDSVTAGHTLLTSEYYAWY